MYFNYLADLVIPFLTHPQVKFIEMETKKDNELGGGSKIE